MYRRTYRQTIALLNFAGELEIVINQRLEISPWWRRGLGSLINFINKGRLNWKCWDQEFCKTRCVFYFDYASKLHDGDSIARKTRRLKRNNFDQNLRSFNIILFSPSRYTIIIVSSVRAKLKPRALFDSRIHRAEQLAAKSALISSENRICAITIRRDVILFVTFKSKLRFWNVA